MGKILLFFSFKYFQSFSSSPTSSRTGYNLASWIFQIIVLIFFSCTIKSNYIKENILNNAKIENNYIFETK